MHAGAEEVGGEGGVGGWRRLRPHDVDGVNAGTALVGRDALAEEVWAAEGVDEERVLVGLRECAGAGGSESITIA